MADVFVAREQELAQLNDFLQQALAGRGQVCFITGEAGAGKTALVTEFARRAQAEHDDLLVAIGMCNAQTGIGDPYLPFRQILGLLTGDVDNRLSQGAVTEENASRLRAALRVSGQAIVELGPDLIDIFVPGSGLVARATMLVSGKIGWFDRLQEFTEHGAAPSSDIDLEQDQIFEQYTRVLQTLAAQQPLIVVLDDLQWADASSISLLFHLGRSIRDSHILLLGAYRPGDVALGRPSTSSGQAPSTSSGQAPSTSSGQAPLTSLGHAARHPLEPVLNEFKRYFGDIRIDVDQAVESEAQRFVDALLDEEPNRLSDGFRKTLYHHTEGHPLFTVELLRAMRQQGHLVRDAEGRWIEGPTLAWDALPARVEGVIEERIGRLETALRDALTVASIEGEDFTAQVIARLQGIQERQLVRQLSQELDAKHRIVGERGREQVGAQRLYLYRFRHSLFQQHLYNELNEIERELLHSEVGAVLEALYGEQSGDIAPQLARHFAAAGEVEKAIPYLLQAADRARTLYAHEEAIDYYQRALELLKAEGEYGLAARTLMKLGLAYHTAFDFERAREAYQEGFMLWQQVVDQRPALALAGAPHPLRMDWDEPETLDPAQTKDMVSMVVIDQLFSGLLKHTPEMDVVPDVARSWDVAEDGRAYVFHLRDDVVWSDGHPVTAHDFVYAWKRLLDPATRAPMASFLYDIKGGRAFQSGEAGNPDGVGVRARDAHTLEVELEEPTSYFLHLLGYPTLYPVPSHVLEAQGDARVEPANIVTNGPFRLVAWEIGKSLILERNPTYHGGFTGNLHRVEFIFRHDWSSGLTAFQRERLDVFRLVGSEPPELHRARQQHAGEYMLAPSFAMRFVAFDVTRPPFNDPRVRQAFTLAVNRGMLADVVLRGLMLPATGGFVPPGMPGHSPAIGLPYDPELARRRLAEAGYASGDTLPPVEFLVPHALLPIGEYLKAQWRDNLAAQVTLHSPPPEVLVVGPERSAEEPPHMFLYGWMADYPDPDDFLRLPFAIARQQGWTWGSWQHPAYDSLIDAARRSSDQDERMRLYGSADSILVEEAPVIPLVYVRQHLLVKPWVRKLPLSGLKHKQSFLEDVVIEPH